LPANQNAWEIKGGWMLNKPSKVAILCVPLIGVIIFGFNNCGRFSQPHEESTENASLGSESLDSQQLGLPYALLSAEQTLSSMMKVTNVTTLSPALKAEYKGRYGALAAGNDLSMANGPLMLGSTSLAGEICNSLLIQEKAMTDVTSRSFFGSIDFTTGVSGLEDNGLNTSIRGMARSFWGRNETLEELTLLQEFRTDFINALTETDKTKPVAIRNLVLATCAAMLSSVDAISY
jgi:hypothetical protein